MIHKNPLLFLILFSASIQLPLQAQKTIRNRTSVNKNYKAHSITKGCIATALVVPAIYLAFIGVNYSIKCDNLAMRTIPNYKTISNIIGHLDKWVNYAPIYKDLAPNQEIANELCNLLIKSQIAGTGAVICAL